MLSGNNSISLLVCVHQMEWKMNDICTEEDQNNLSRRKKASLVGISWEIVYSA